MRFYATSQNLEQLNARIELAKEANCISVMDEAETEMYLASLPRWKRWLFIAMQGTFQAAQVMGLAPRF